VRSSEGRARNGKVGVLCSLLEGCGEGNGTENRTWRSIVSKKLSTKEVECEGG
jgi:hypothetical protein